MSLVSVQLWEEKGSDVNIATHLLVGGFRQEYEQAIVLSNDSDLVEPIRMVRKESGLRIGVLSPHSQFEKPSYHLRKVASSYHHVDRSLLGQCQLPTSIRDASGRQIVKPQRW